MLSFGCGWHCEVVVEDLAVGRVGGRQAGKPSQPGSLLALPVWIALLGLSVLLGLPGLPNLPGSPVLAGLPDRPRLLCLFGLPRLAVTH